MIQKWKDSTPLAAQQQRESWWTCMRFSTDIRSCASMQRSAYFHDEEDEDVFCWPPKEWVQRYHGRGGRVENPWWELKRQLCGRRKAAKKFNEVVVVTATDGLGIEQCPEQPSLFRRPGTTLILECHQDDFYVSGSNVELAWLQENLGARLKLKPAEPMGPGSQYSCLRATRTRIGSDTIHVAPRQTYIKNVLDILGLGDEQVQTDANPDSPNASEEVTKMSQDWVKKIEELITGALAFPDIP